MARTGSLLKALWESLLSLFRLWAKLSFLELYYRTAVSLPSIYLVLPSTFTSSCDSDRSPTPVLKTAMISKCPEHFKSDFSCVDQLFKSILSAKGLTYFNWHPGLTLFLSYHVMELWG